MSSVGSQEVSADVRSPIGSGSARTVRKTERLLIVDDHPRDVWVLRRHLALMNDISEVTCCSSCAEAVAFLANHKVTLVLLELGLPDSFGLDTLRAIREATPHSAVIVMTGRDDERLALAAIRMGAQECINKAALPFHLLGRSLREALERKRLEWSFEAVSCSDTLTGLANRGRFARQVAQALARGRRRGEPFAIMYVDLDGFKQVNDTAGHHVGDAALVEVAKRLLAQVRQYDTVARLGGDEFGVLLEGIESQPMAALASRMIASIGHPIEVGGGHTVTVGASIGIAVSPRSGDTVEVLLRAADSAMYSAKHEGRNTFRFHDPSSVLIDDPRELEARVREALLRRHFNLCFRHQVDLVTGSVRGFDVLLQWHTEHGEPHESEEFLPALRGTPMGRELAEWLLREAFANLRRWQDEGRPPVSLTLNMSLDDLREGEHLARMMAGAAEMGISCSCVEIAISEAEALRDLPRSKRTFSQLREQGFQVVVSNFGSGAASLTLLDELSPDCIKVDRSCIGRLGFDASGRSLAGHIAQLANGMDIAVIADGVESMPQLLYLKNAGYQRAQGPFVTLPLAQALLKGALTPETASR